MKPNLLKMAVSVARTDVKKVVMFLFVLAFVSSAAFAQLAEGITVTGKGNGVMAPVIISIPDKGSEIYGKRGQPKVFAGTGISWDNSISIELYVKGTSDSIGFDFGIGAHPGWSVFREPIKENKDPYWGFTDDNDIWVKPFSNELLTLKVGSFNIDNLRGWFGGVDYPMPFVLAPKDEDNIFQRFGARANDPGFAFYSKPTDNLFIFAGVKAKGLFSHVPTTTVFYTVGGDLVSPAEDVYKGIQAGIGYNIPDIGLVRLQYIGATGKGYYDLLSESLVMDSPSVQAAFAYSGLGGAVTLDIGARVYFPVKNTTGIDVDEDDIDIKSGIKAHTVAMGFLVTNGIWGITGRLDTAFGGKFEIESGAAFKYGFNMSFNVLPFYDFGKFKAGVHFGLIKKNASTLNGIIQPDDTMQMGVGLMAHKDFSNGNIKGGIAVQLPEQLHGVRNPASFAAISFPILMEYWF